MALVGIVAMWNGPHRPTLVAIWADWSLGVREQSGFDLLARREPAGSAILKSLGDGPHPGAVTKIEVKPLPSSSMLMIERITYSSSDGDNVAAIIGYPEGQGSPRGLVLALHQTTDCGMLEPMGLCGNPELAFGTLLQQSGYMVVAPEAFATRVALPPSKRWLTTEFYQRHPAWSAMGKMLADNKAALSTGVDAYRRRYGAEPDCIAAVGHSLGAHNALFLAAFDQRVDAVVASAGFERMASDKEAIRWARDEGFVYMPALADAVRGKAPLTWDWEDVLMQVYPRGAKIVQGLADPIFTNEISVAQSARGVQEAYRQGGHAHMFDVHLWPGGHAFPISLQKESAEFIAKACAETG